MSAAGGLAASPRGAYERFDLADSGGAYVYDADESTPSAFRTPEQQAAAPAGDRRPVSAIALDERGEHAQAGGGEALARDFAQSHFRRRNRLESRLEELQRDVAKLTTKLRAGSARSASSLAQPSFDRSMDAAVAEEQTQVSRGVNRASPASAAKKVLVEWWCDPIIGTNAWGFAAIEDGGDAGSPQEQYVAWWTCCSSPILYECHRSQVASGA